MYVKNKHFKQNYDNNNQNLMKKLQILKNN